MWWSIKSSGSSLSRSRWLEAYGGCIAFATAPAARRPFAASAITHLIGSIG
jgi:hypothetical protein